MPLNRMPVPPERRRAEADTRPSLAPYPSDVDVIEQTVLKAFALPVASLRSRKRGPANVAFARQVAIYMAHVCLGLTLTDTGRLFGRDRTTAAHACRIVEDRRDDRLVDLKVDAIEQSLGCWHPPVPAARRVRGRRRLLQ